MNCADLIIRAIDWFNEHFRERNSPFIMEDLDLDVYQFYMAKKNGKPNDDFPSKNSFNYSFYLGIEKSQIVAKINYSRFALCVEQRALHSNSHHS